MGVQTCALPICAVASSLISFGFFRQVRGSLGMVTEHSMPAVTAALTLAAQSADLAAAAPTLANAVDDKTRAAAYGQLQSRLSRIDTTMQQVRSGQPSAAVLGEEIGRASCRERVCQYV